MRTEKHVERNEEKLNRIIDVDNNESGRSERERDTKSHARRVCVCGSHLAASPQNVDVGLSLTFLGDKNIVSPITSLQTEFRLLGVFMRCNRFWLITNSASPELFPVNVRCDVSVPHFFRFARFRWPHNFAFCRSP